MEFSLFPPPGTAFGKPLVKCSRTDAAAPVKDFLELDFLVFPTSYEAPEAYRRLFGGSA